MTSTQPGPTFIASRPHGYGAEGEPEGMSDTPRTVGLVVTGLALVAMVTVFINITPPPSSRPIPTRNVPRSRPSRW